MAAGHGSKAVVKVDNGAGALTDITAFLTSASLERLAELVDVATLGDTAREYLPGLQDASITLEGNWDPTVDLIFHDDIGASASKTWEYGPQGAATGATRYTGEAFFSGYSISTPLDEKGTFTVNMQVTGVITRNTFP